MKKVKNSRNTSNPYELISGVELISKNTKNLKVGIYGFKYESIDNKNRFVVKSFNVSDKPEARKEKDIETVKVFKRIRKFAAKCNNPLEVITLFIDAYKQNKGLLNIKFRIIPTHCDALDSKFVYEQLLGDAN